MKLLHAYTDMAGEYRDYPGYVNLSENDLGTPVLIVRSREGVSQAQTALPVAELLKMADAIYARYAVSKVVNPDGLKLPRMGAVSVRL